MAAHKKTYPIKHWSYSSLVSYLRNPLAWYKRYVENIRDMPSTPSGVVGRAGHKALEHYYLLSSEDHKYLDINDRASDGGKLSVEPLKAYSGELKEYSIEQGLQYLRLIPDFEIDFGKAETKTAQKKKRASMEREYLQAINFYLKRAPRYKVLGVEVMSTAKVKGLPLPVKAISDLVVESKGNPGMVDIVDHKFVDSFSPLGSDKPLFVLQAIFNYYTVLSEFKKPVKRFILQECKKRKNKDGKSQMKKHIIHFEEIEEDFALFHRLMKDASDDIASKKRFLPNPSDMFEGKNSFEIYRFEL